MVETKEDRKRGKKLSELHLQAPGVTQLAPKFLCHILKLLRQAPELQLWWVGNFAAWVCKSSSSLGKFDATCKIEGALFRLTRILLPFLIFPIPAKCVL
jgi:hypothetical protein